MNACTPVAVPAGRTGGRIRPARQVRIHAGRVVGDVKVRQAEHLADGAHLALLRRPLVVVPVARHFAVLVRVLALLALKGEGLRVRLRLEIGGVIRGRRRFVGGAAGGVRSDRGRGDRASRRPHPPRARQAIGTP
jgi:hypothetical protein